jgi:predicted membrane protein (TIGR00267 family)
VRAVRDGFAGLRTALGRGDVRAISRRYFVSNGFDGALTSIGVVVGAFLSGVPDGATVVKIGLGGAVGLATSGAWSVWEIERAEKRAELHTLEDAMLADLSGTHLERMRSRARLVNAAASGLGPVIGALGPLSPFLLEGAVLSMAEATVAGVGVGVALLFGFGAYMGSISEQNWVVAGVRMGAAGVVVAVLNLVLP